LIVFFISEFGMNNLEQCVVIKLSIHEKITFLSGYLSEQVVHK